MTDQDSKWMRNDRESFVRSGTPTYFKAANFSNASLEACVARTPMFSFLFRPYLFVATGFFLLMAALSFANESVSGLANALRWPALGVMAIAGLMLWIFGKNSLKPSMFHVCWGATIAMMFLSTFYSIDKAYTFQRAASIVLLFTSTMIGIHLFARTPQNLVRLTDLLWWIGGALVVLGLIYSRGAAGRQDRYEGAFSKATGAGGFAVMFLPIAIYQLRYRLRGIWKPIGWCFVGLLFVQLVLSGARAALVFGCFICLILWFDYYGKKAIFALLAMALFAPVPFLLSQRATDQFTEKSEKLVRAKSLENFTGRLDRWLFGLKKFSEKPVTGRGFGASRIIAGIDGPNKFKLKGREFYLHSDQIELLVDLGILGFVPFTLFWCVVWFRGAKILFQPRDARRQIALAYLGAAFFVFGDTFMHGSFLSAGSGTSSFSWSMIAVLLAITSPTFLVARPRQLREAADAVSPSIGEGFGESSWRRSGILEPVNHGQIAENSASEPVELPAVSRPRPSVRDIVMSQS